MPELPEVETIARTLREGGRRYSELANPSAAVIGRRIRSAQLFWERTIAEPSAVDFLARLPGQWIESVSRRAKYLLIGLSQDTLILHLRMSGDVIVEPNSAALRAHDRLVLELEGQIRLAFNDTRKFGRVWLVPDPERVLAGLGPEPLADDFTAARLTDILAPRRRQLKALLLDQRAIAGLGNIYVDEALFRARLHPLRLASSLSLAEVERLHTAIRAVLLEGIQQNGASIDWVYRGGEFQRHFRVYGRAGEPCLHCGTPIERIVVGQRGTHICPTCQGRMSMEDE